MAQGPAVPLVLAALLASGAASGAEPESGAAREPHAGDAIARAPHAGDATANIRTQSPTAVAVPDAPAVLGPRLRRRDTSATRMETEPPRRGPRPRYSGEAVRDLGSGNTADGAAHATADRLPQPSDPVLAIAASPSTRSASEPAALLQACVDRELASRGLNGFGEPPGTEYPDGTPVDASSLARYDYVLRRSPAVRTACAYTTPFR